MQWLGVLLLCFFTGALRAEEHELVLDLDLDKVGIYRAGPDYERSPRATHGVHILLVDLRGPGAADDVFAAYLISTHPQHEGPAAWALGTFQRQQLEHNALQPWGRNLSVVPSVIGSMFIMSRAFQAGSRAAGLVGLSRAFGLRGLLHPRVADPVARTLATAYLPMAGAATATRAATDWSRTAGASGEVVAFLNGLADRTNPSYASGRGTVEGVFNGFLRETPTILESMPFMRDRLVTGLHGAIVLQSATADGAKDLAIKVADIIHDLNER